jgi:glutamyl-tRNA(Gln) amidotransferase subunit E
LPGADRMYPDTDSVPIPLADDYIESLKSKLPNEITERYQQLSYWQIPEDTYTYIFRNNLYPLLEKIVEELNVNPIFVGTFLGHTMKWIEGHYKPASEFSFNKIYDLFAFLQKNHLHFNLAKKIMPISYQYPMMDFESIIESIKFQKKSESELKEKIDFLNTKFEEIKKRSELDAKKRWIMGQIHHSAIGNIDLAILENHIVD